MKCLNIPGTDLKLSNMVMGCMRLAKMPKAEIRPLVETALECGINHFDHADVYGGGTCETLFSEAMGMSDDFRERIVLQSKCGIRKDSPLVSSYFDFSRAHILESVDGILRRLKTDYLDILLLHRPDALMEPDEVAEAFEELTVRGKVRHFGVSNMNPLQIELLQRPLKQPLIFNQLQFSVAHTPLIDHGMTMNMAFDQSVNRTSNALEYARLKGMTIQAWSPFQWGKFAGVYLGDNERYPELNAAIDRLAKQYGLPADAIAIAWITRHPANMQVILGTTRPDRLKDACQGADLRLTREEWYALYKAAGNTIP